MGGPASRPVIWRSLGGELLSRFLLRYSIDLGKVWQSRQSIISVHEPKNKRTRRPINHNLVNSVLPQSLTAAKLCTSWLGTFSELTSSSCLRLQFDMRCSVQCSRSSRNDDSMEKGGNLTCRIDECACSHWKPVFLQSERGCRQATEPSPLSYLDDLS